MKFTNLNAAIGRPKPPRSPDPVKPTVILQPAVYHEMLAGINLIAEAIRPTLGPFPRHVAMERPLRTDAPEFLDDASVIARRIIQIKPRTRDVGAMLLRKSLWQMHEDVGDGSATMGVIFQRIYNEGVRFITEFGCNPMLLRNGFDKGLKAIVQELRLQAVPLKGRQSIARIALGMTQGDEGMADLLGEIFDIVGKDGLIVVEKWNRPGMEREYIEGTYWHISGWFSRLFINEPKEKRVTYEDAALLITDMELKEPLHLVPVLERCVKAGIQKLVIVAAEISGPCIGLLEQNKQARTIEAMAVRTPRTGETQRVAAIEDIAVLTGGRPFYKAASQNFEDFQVEDLGYARRAWATESLFGIYGGKGSVRNIRQRIAHLRAQIQGCGARFGQRVITGAPRKAFRRHGHPAHRRLYGNRDRLPQGSCPARRHRLAPGHRGRRGAGRRRRLVGLPGLPQFPACSQRG